MKALLSIVIALVAAVAAAADRHPITTIILVRHAEKAPVTSTEDMPLSDAGRERASELARVLAGTKIDAIYTTQYQRTRQTAEPLAKLLGIEPHVVTAVSGQPYAAALADRIRKDHPGQTVLVVGHSNSTRDTLKHLGVSDAPPIAESQYDDLFVCTLAAGQARLVALRYGAVKR